MESPRKKDYSERLTRTGFTPEITPVEPAPALWAARQQLLCHEDVFRRQRKSGKLRWLATASRRDICARLARAASRAETMKGGDVYRISGLAETVRVWKQATILKYA